MRLRQIFLLLVIAFLLSITILGCNAEEEDVLPQVNEELKETHLLKEFDFPEEIPLPGGQVDESKYVEMPEGSILIRTSSSLEDSEKWYKAHLQEEGWETTDLFMPAKERVMFKALEGHLDDDYEIMVLISVREEFTDISIDVE